MEADTGRSDTGRGIGAGIGAIRGLPIRGLCLLAAICFCLVLAPAAVATSPSPGLEPPRPPEMVRSVRTGVSASAPTEEAARTLTFPELGGCTAPKACYSSENDVSELSAEALRIDDGENYVIKGDELTLGSGGLTASPEGGVSGALDEIEAPLEPSEAAEMDHRRKR